MRKLFAICFRFPLIGGLCTGAIIGTFMMTPADVASAFAEFRSQSVGSRDVECFSGGKSIYQGQTDPAYPVYLGSQDHHVTFVDRATHRQTRVGGNCIVRWDLPKAPS